MRNAFAAEVTQAARADTSVVMLSGDIGNKLFDDFKRHAPERFFNCGVAEQNMIGVAAGMAMSGMRPVAYTITPFITYRCYEQIRVDLCYHNQPVVIVGVGSGLGYASLGGTHHSCEDIAALRALPHMAVLCPGDPHEVGPALREALKWNGPSYIRLGKKGEPKVHQNQPALTLGKATVVKNGTHVTLLSTGTILPVAMNAANKLEARGISTEVVSFHTVKPLDLEILKDRFAKRAVVATIEEHSLLGGFGSAVAEWLVDQAPQKARLVRFGTPDEFFHEAGEQDHAREKFGLTDEHIASRVASLIGRVDGI